jgi:hypothetical protein
MRRAQSPSRAAARNCGAVATLSAFLNDATLRGGLLGRIPTYSTNWGRNSNAPRE